MNRKERIITRTCNIVSAVLILALILCHFMPYWSTDGDTASVWGYLGLKHNHKILTVFFDEEIGGCSINSAVAMPIVVIVLGVVGIYCGLKNIHERWSGVFPAACGVVGLLGYLTQPVYSLGNVFWLHILLCVALIAVAAVQLVPWIKGLLKKE